MRERGPEFVALLLIAAAGMDLLAASNGFVTLFVSLELFSITLYMLCAFDVRSPVSLESGLKYLVLGSIGSAVLLYGAAFLYGSTGSLHVRRHRARARERQAHRRSWRSPAPRSCSPGSASRSRPCRSTCGRPTSTRARRRR